MAVERTGPSSKEPAKVIRRSPEMVLVAYALARLGHRADGQPDDPPAFLKTPNWRKAYALFYPHFHDGRALRSFQSSLMAARHAFDDHLTARPRAWRMKRGVPAEPQGLFKATLDAWKDRSDEDLRDAVLHILARNPAEPELLQDLQDILNSSATMKTALVQARIGQGAYRADLMKAWSDRCAVPTNVRVISDRANRLKGNRSLQDLRARAAQGGSNQVDYAKTAAYVDRELLLGEVRTKASGTGRAAAEWQKVAEFLDRAFANGQTE